MNEIEKYRSKRIDLCIKHNVSSLYVFGSSLTTEFKKSSDLDFLVTFQPMDYGDYAYNYFDLADELERLFHRPVDLITEKSLSNPYVITSVNQTKKLIYAR